MSYILEIDNVVKDFANHRALDNVSLKVPTGSIYGLLGPNGAGKTSLIRIITGITRADSGTVTFKGEPWSTKHIPQIGYLPEERGLYKKMKIGEQLIYLAELRGLSASEARERIKPWVEKFDLKQWMNSKVEDLSKGMGQKVQFIATVLHKPELLILDEPFSGFDPINANILRDEILRMRKEGTTIIFSTHRMETVEELCDDVCLINKSTKILEGSKETIRAQYSKNLYELTGKGTLQLPEGSELIIEKQGEVFNTWLFRLPDGYSVNHLIVHNLTNLELRSVQEMLPNMRDIFISAVTNTPIYSQSYIEEFSPEV